VTGHSYVTCILFKLLLISRVDIKTTIDMKFKLKCNICVHRITWFLGFLHRPVFWGVETRRFGNWICFRPKVKGEKTPIQLGPLESAILNHWTL
jgi:hypothetical protein